MEEAEINALKERMDLIWEQHVREHSAHEIAHAREHEFAQRAIDTAAVLSKENKADANEWRASMTDRERRFATVDDVTAIMARVDRIEKAILVTDERERNRLITEAEEKRDTERRINHGQWIVGLAITGIVIAINVALKILE